jgi:hypothetical protein
LNEYETVKVGITSLTNLSKQPHPPLINQWLDITLFYPFLPLKLFDVEQHPFITQSCIET